MLCCDSPGRSVYPNLCAKNKFSLVMSGSKSPRNKKDGFLAGFDDLQALSWSFLLYFGGQV